MKQSLLYDSNSLAQQTEKLNLARTAILATISQRNCVPELLCEHRYYCGCNKACWFFYCSQNQFFTGLYLHNARDQYMVAGWLGLRIKTKLFKTMSTRMLASQLLIIFFFVVIATYHLSNNWNNWVTLEEAFTPTRYARRSREFGNRFILSIMLLLVARRLKHILDMVDFLEQSLPAINIQLQPTRDRRAAVYLASFRAAKQSISFSVVRF